jgi:membrane protease YdiL (CAAX protease family)
MLSPRSTAARDLIVFTIFALLLPWLGVALDFLTGNDPHNPEQSFGWPLFLIAPLCTVLLLRLFRKDWKDFGLAPALRGNGGWYLFALLFPPASTLLLLALGVSLGAVLIPDLSTTGLAMAGGALLAASLPTFAKNLFEEFAWRGYLTPKLQVVLKNRLAGHLLTGAIWFAWHLPYYLYLLAPGALQQATSLSTGALLAAGAIGILPAAVIYGELRLRTGSVWPAVLIHTSGNLFFDVLAARKFFQFASPATEAIFTPAMFGAGAIVLNCAVGLWLYRMGGNGTIPGAGEALLFRKRL